MNACSHRAPEYGGAAPATPGFTAFGPEWRFYRAANAAPAVPAAESALGSHPCVALSSAQVLPEWPHQYRRSMLLQRAAITPLTSCLSLRVHFIPECSPARAQ